VQLKSGIRGVAFGGSDLIRRGLLYNAWVRFRTKNCYVFVFLMVTKKMKKDHNKYVSAATCIVWV
jgi:hypothetical protein